MGSPERSPRTSGDSCSAGFTLIEMVVVVTLVLVMTSIISPTFVLTPTRRVTNMAHQLAGELELARSEALGERRRVRIVFDTIASTYTAYIDHDRDDSIGVVAPEVAAFPAFGVRTLTDLVRFGRGAADTIPGDPVDAPVALIGSQLDISSDGIPVPWGTMGTIYLVSSRESSAVSAVSVSSSGSFRAWRWWPNPGEWR